MRTCAWIACLGAWLLLGAGVVASEIVVTDDDGREVRLARPATRIVSVAPHVTELVFAAGAGERIVGAVEYSDHPEAARRIPRIGDVRALDLERVVALRPDLIVVWLKGTPPRQIAALRALGIPMVHDEPSRLEQIPRSLRRLGRLAGTQAVAEAAAAAFEARLAALRARYAGRPLLSVFYQVWHRPLMTVSGGHVVSDAIRLCGGRNVFEALGPLVPTMSLEAVLEADPDVIAYGAARGAPDVARELWRRWPAARAVAAGNLLALDADAMNRHTPRVLDGVEALCEGLERARAARR